MKRVKREEEKDIKHELRKFISPSAAAMIAGSQINSLGKEILMNLRVSSYLLFVVFIVNL